MQLLARLPHYFHFTAERDPEFISCNYEQELQRGLATEVILGDGQNID
jgi:hypothetical protein